MLFNKFKIETDLIEVNLGKSNENETVIKTKIKASDKSWIDVEDYPFTEPSMIAILDLAINVNSGKLLLKGLHKEEKKLKQLIQMKDSDDVVDAPKDEE